MNKQADFNQRHYQLLELQKNASVDFRVQVQQFIKELQSAGRDTYDMRERDQLRSYLRFWTSALHDMEPSQPYQVVELEIYTGPIPKSKRWLWVGIGTILILILILLSPIIIYMGYVASSVSATPSSTSTKYISVTPSETFTLTPTFSPTLTPTPTATITPTPTPTPVKVPFSVSDNFVDSGYMGDIGDITIRSSPDPITQLIVYHITYKKEGKKPQCSAAPSPCEFAGVYWLNPVGNWGTVPNAGYNLSRAKKISFSVRGTPGITVLFFTGSDQILTSAEFPYPNSSKKINKYVTLTDSWADYSIDLEDADLDYVVTGFGWSADWGQFVNEILEIRFDVTNIRFEE